jgi:GNAT superfamily N-acetyltransferase
MAGQAIENLAVSFAGEEDGTWLVRNDSNRHISPELVLDKVARKEYIVARVYGNPVGYMRLSYFWSFIPCIDMIAVEEPYRRSGIGRAMLGFLEAHARQRGNSLIMSSSQADEPEPQAWHRAVGFEDAGAIVSFEPIQDVPEIVFIKRVGRNV